MNLLEFILTFLILVILGSGACIGFYIISRGSWEITPDGKWKKTGMIFKYWSLFWEQYRKTKTVYFSGRGLKEKYEFLFKVHPQLAQLFSLSETFLRLNTGSKLVDKDLTLIEDCLVCKATFYPRDSALMLHIEAPVYDFPEWIQKPISSCPTCFAGPYGTAIWVVFLKLQRDSFVWTDTPIFGQIFFGAIFLLTLAMCNNWLSLKLKL